MNIIDYCIIQSNAETKVGIRITRVINLITRNTKDLKDSDIPVLSPDEYLKSLKAQYECSDWIRLKGSNVYILVQGNITIGYTSVRYKAGRANL